MTQSFNVRTAFLAAGLAAGMAVSIPSYSIASEDGRHDEPSNASFGIAVRDGAINEVRFEFNDIGYSRLDSSRHYALPPEYTPDSIRHLRKLFSTVLVDRNCSAGNVVDYKETGRPHGNKLSLSDVLKSTSGAVMSFSGDSMIHVANRLSDNIASMYFLPDDYDLTKSDSTDVYTLALLLKRLQARQSLDRVLIEAYADKTAPAQLLSSEDKYNYNLELSRKRGEAVLSLLKKYFKELGIRAPMEVVAFGDANPLSYGDMRDTKESYARNRVVNIIPNMDIINRGLDIIDRDYVFDDFSGSMGWPRSNNYIPWNIIKKRVYECGDSIYIFNKDIGLDGVIYHEQDGWPINHPYLKPIGQTPLKESMLYASLVVDPGSRLLFVTDGSATDCNLDYDEIINVAKRRGVKISFVSSTLDQNNIAVIQRIAMETGGNFYAH